MRHGWHFLGMIVSQAAFVSLSPAASSSFGCKAITQIDSFIFQKIASINATKTDHMLRTLTCGNYPLTVAFLGQVLIHLSSKALACSAQQAA